MVLTLLHSLARFRRSGVADNLFRNADGELLVGAFQKSGMYHAMYATTMQATWSSTVAGTCHLCNADLPHGL
jgi:hypothetical protein